MTSKMEMHMRGVVKNALHSSMNPVLCSTNLCVENVSVYRPILFPHKVLIHS